ncbi:DNA methylase [Mesorhizobium sp. B2-4-13]|uniref:DNA methyltransferase n=1 Tax=Mesorhizobium sp. B2-4-13 TaxID=2589936 RepID=UPI001151F6E3|nr:DNA methyltransferase [Mesorhizobium sp. B2-4-13]TPK79022.1 DNA methylase [Mesorhizobium sp. B2-4-13]
MSAPLRLQGHRAVHCDCIEAMQRLPAGSVDFILTDPPYLVSYRDRHGRTVANDDNADWLAPAFAQMHRVLKDGGYCVSFYGWNQVDRFMAAWRGAGFHIVGHLVFTKPYASSRRHLAHHHEQAYLLAKGRPPCPRRPLPDVLPWDYTGNRLHPTQKPIRPLQMLIESLSRPGDLVLDAFCGSGSTLVAAQASGRHCLGFDLDARHAFTAGMRLHSSNSA